MTKIVESTGYPRLYAIGPHTRRPVRLQYVVAKPGGHPYCLDSNGKLWCKSSIFETECELQEARYDLAEEDWRST